MIFLRKYRLASKHDFQSVFASPSSRLPRKFLLVLARHNVLGYARIGIVISKTHVKRAVDRNRLRRVIRESFRHQHARLPAMDILVLIKKSPDNRLLREDIEAVWPLLMTA